MNIKSDRLSLHIYFRDIGVQQCGYIYLGFNFVPLFCNHERDGVLNIRMTSGGIVECILLFVWINLFFSPPCALINGLYIRSTVTAIGRRSP